MNHAPGRRRVTLAADDARLVTMLKRRLGMDSDVDVIRKGLNLLRETMERQAAYRRASRAVRKETRRAIAELDHLSDEGLD